MSADAHTIFREGSQTYYYSSKFFNKTTHDAVTTLYAFVRVADDFVDDTPQDEEGFYAFRDDYHSDPPSNSVVRDYKALADTHDFPSEWTKAFLDSMERDLSQDTYPSLDELKEYMYGSAEVIGLMLCRILNVSEDAYEGARSLGRGMQYINFLRDITEDHEYGRTYIPQSRLKEYGLSDVTRSAAKSNPAGFKELIRDETRRGRQWLNRGRNDFDALPRRARISVATATDMYEWTANQIQSNPFIVYEDKVEPSMYHILFTGIKNSIYDG